MKKATINWATYYDVDVILCSEGEDILKGKGTPYPMPHVMGESVRRVTEDGKTYFVLAFNADLIPTAEVIAHECFHMFFQILGYSESAPMYAEELTKEIYAIKYEDLVHKTMNALQKLGAFTEKKTTRRKRA